MARSLPGDRGQVASLAGWDAGPAPRLDPLAYPGRWPPRSVLLTRDGLRGLDLAPGDELGAAGVDRDGDGHGHGHEAGPGAGPSLDRALDRLGAAPLGDRTPVLAVGSNASPAQLRHKFTAGDTSPVLPMVAVAVTGLASGVAAFVSSAGYLPAAPVLGPELTGELFVLWLDPGQLARLDATEPNYRRLQLTAASGVRITPVSGDVLDACDVYACIHGHLAPGGTPRLLDDQAVLLGELLAASPRLRELMGHTPATWIARAVEPSTRDAVRAVFRAENWVAFCL